VVVCYEVSCREPSESSCGSGGPTIRLRLVRQCLWFGVILPYTPSICSSKTPASSRRGFAPRVATCKLADHESNKNSNYNTILMQAELQLLPELPLAGPSSQVSPKTLSMMPSPHAGVIWQLGEQPSMVP
jgi:hypothetical protein